jgi:hypothetical protein
LVHCHSCYQCQFTSLSVKPLYKKSLEIVYSEVNSLTQQALFLAIGCHLTQTAIEKIYPTIAYTVGNVKERLQAPTTSEISWCDAYKDALDDIISEEAGAKFYIGSAKRKGLSDLREFR